MGRPRKNPTEGTTAVTEPQPKPRMSGKALWWIGLLPATEPVSFPAPTVEPNEETGEYYKIVKHDPLDLWLGKAKG